LISMFSVAGDRVLDPFLGIGTTLLAAMATGRNAIGFELESEFRQTIAQSLTAGVPIAHRRIAERIANHLKFLQERIAAGRTIKHRNHFYGFPVMTRQEVNLAFHRPIAVSQPGEDMFTVDYDLFTMKDNPLPQSPPAGPRPSSPTTGHPQQGLLFE
ncbi:MAG: DNA methyltransferase, partial [Desulfobacterales bacterium]